MDLIIRGELVGLGPLRRDLLETYARWINDLRVNRTLGTPRGPYSLERETDWLDYALTSAEPTFTIYELESGKPIGNTGFHVVDRANGSADWGIMIGEPDVWGRGYGTETARLMLQYAFDVLGLHNVMLRAFANNERAIRAYEKAGYRRIGVRRGAIRAGRRRLDEVLMDATADDLEPSHLDGIMRGA